MPSERDPLLGEPHQDGVRSLGRLEELIGYLPDIAFVVRSDDGQILAANAAAARVYGYAPAELVARTIQDIEAPDTLVKMVSTPREQALATLRSETLHRRKDGGILLVDVSRRELVLGGERVALLVVREIVAKVRPPAGPSEDASQGAPSSEPDHHRLRFFKTAIDRAPLCAYWLDSTGKCVYVNDAACRTLGYTRDELLQMNIIDIARGSPELWLRIFESIKSRGSTTMQSRHYRKDGEPVDVEITSFYLRWDDMEYTIGFAADIRERLAAQRERETLQRQFNQAQKLESIGRLAGGIAHDFNNVLMVIRLSAEEMRLQELPAPLQENLDVIEEAAARASALTRQLLTFARRQAVIPQVADLNERVGGLIVMLRRLLGENLVIDWRPQPNLWPVSIDPSQLDQLLTNLCVNARDAIQDVGTVTIRVANRDISSGDCLVNPGFLPGEFVELSVSDNGCGMDAETLASIFEPFFTTKPEGQGTGLGLATVYGIVKQSGGFIGVSSVKGEGTTFTVYLPHARERARRATPPATQRVSRASRGTILVVENEPAILRMITRLLEREGYLVLAAPSPDEALRLSAKHVGEIHLLLTDVILPGMNGRDLSQRLGAGRSGLKCVFMSGYTGDVMGQHSVLESTVAYLQKPFPMDDLLEKVATLLELGIRPT